MNLSDEDHLEALLKQVCDETSFLAFVDALADDAVKGSGWENGTIENFLESAHAWGEGTADHPDFEFTKQNAWQRCAWIIFAGKFYE